jgi:MFS family permease
MFGPLGDRVGRKPILLLSSTITASCSLASSYAPTFEALVLLRFGVGIGVGGTVVPFDMLAELTPSRFRGAFLLYVGYFWTVGTSATPALAWYAMQEHGSWRLLLLLCSIPGFVSMVFGYLWVPESPRWLMTKGRSEEALAILKEGATSNQQIADKVYPPGTTIVLSREEAETVEKMNSLASLFLPEWRLMVICMLLVWSFLDFIYWGNIQVVTLVFAEYEGNLELFEEGSQYAYDYGAIIGSSLAEIVGQTAVLLLIDRIGRVPTQAVAYAAGALSVFCLCFVAYIEDTGSETERYVLVLLAFCARMFIMAATSVTWYVYRCAWDGWSSHAVMVFMPLPYLTTLIPQRTGSTQQRCSLLRYETRRMPWQMHWLEQEAL